MVLGCLLLVYLLGRKIELFLQFLQAELRLYELCLQLDLTCLVVVCVVVVCSPQLWLMFS